MLGCWCRRETEERQKERRADSRVPTMLSMPPCLSIPLYPDRVVPARGLPVSISSDGKSGFVPKSRNVYSRPLLPSSVEQWEA